MATVHSYVILRSTDIWILEGKPFESVSFRAPVETSFETLPGTIRSLSKCAQADDKVILLCQAEEKLLTRGQWSLLFHQTILARWHDDVPFFYEWKHRY
ncbi:uncharacterized protein LMH87_007565 [Akanthomyces muscarius]|uniref:Uncharacterized protein n=1 Tax=Akanthomyces muscarius TaxID=2231603 RepID=A0A9W8UR89_AKAMU|nr:uncharacterized protein LMH87_007565 [Akanthomyces muscarius]KAJ4161529.1 hypothetical protein LMH87_007565 [Akanthomyces muscarius]